MILGIIWWGMLLSKKNSEIHLLKSNAVSNQDDLVRLEKERSRQTVMILGEGFVLGCSLLLGIYIINRSAGREIQNARQQSDFLLSVSHELKSPIAAIKLAMQTLFRPGLTKQQESQIYNSALEDTRRLEKLVQNILLSANIESNALELYKTEANLSLLIQDIIKSYESENLEHHFIVKSDSSIIKIDVDVQNIKQAISNIVDNAVKYAPPKTPIIIELWEESAFVFCSISNSGPPILSNEISKIFKRFFRGSNAEVRKKEGTGIGLYITNEIIKAHGGTISVESAHGINLFKIGIPKNG